MEVDSEVAGLREAIFGGWMIALMVWLMPSAHHARMWVILIITWCLAAAELTHIIAGSLDVMFAVMSGAVSWGRLSLALPSRPARQQHRRHRFRRRPESRASRPRRGGAGELTRDDADA